MRINSDEQFWAVAAKRLSHLFPRLPKRPAFGKRRLPLSDTIEVLIKEFARHSPGQEADLVLVDSTPIECGRSIETTRRSALADAADYGYCASHSRLFWGCRLHGLFACDGTPRALTLTSPKAGERELCLGMFARLGTGPVTVIGDKGYAGREFQAQAARLGALIVRPRRKDEPGTGSHLAPIRLDVSVGGFNGTSTNQPGPGTYLQTGMETTDHSASESAGQSGLAWYNSVDNSKHDNWGGSTYKYITPGAGIAVNWATFGSSFDVSINPCRAAAMRVPAAPTTASPELTQPQLRDLTTSFAAHLGEANPANLQDVQISRTEAVPLITGGETVDDPKASANVFVITAAGSFHGDFAHRPPTADAPSGNALELVVDAHTGEITDWGLDRSVPNLAGAGSVQTP